MKGGKRRLGRHRAGSDEGNRNQMVEIGSCSQSEKLHFCLKDEHEGYVERGWGRYLFLECDMIRSSHSSDPGFPLSLLGLTVTGKFFPPVIAWETEGARSQRGENETGFLEFLSCLGDGCFPEFKGETQLAYKVVVRWLVNIFVCVDQPTSWAQLVPLFMCPLLHQRHIYIS